MSSFKIYHDSDHFEILNNVNALLEKHNLRFSFWSGVFDGYDVVDLKTVVDVQVVDSKTQISVSGEKIANSR